MSTVWRVDPVRIAELATRIRATITELDGIRSADPEAGPAVDALRAATESLRTSLLPAVDDLVATTAFTRAPECRVGEPLRDRPATTRPAPATPAGRAAGMVEAILDSHDPTRTIVRLERLVSRHPRLVDRERVADTSLWTRLVVMAGAGGPDAAAASALIARLVAGGDARSDRLDALGMAGAHSGDGVRLIGAVAARLADRDLVALIARLLDTRARPRPGVVHQPSLVASIHHLLDAVVDRPGALLTLGDDTATLMRLIGDDGLDAETVTAALAGVLTVLGPAPMLGHLLHAEDRSVGAARVGALTLAAVLDDLTPSLSSTVIVLPDAGRSVVVGDRRLLDALFIDIAADREATAVLGIAIGALRTIRIERALEAITDDVPHGEQTVAATLAGQLAGVDRLTDLLADSADGAVAAAAAGRATLLSNSSDALVLLGAIASVTAPQVRPALSLIGVIGSRLAEAAHRPSAPGDDADHIAMATEVEVIAAIAATPDLHLSLGLEGVPDSTWEEVRDLVGRHRGAGDDEARAETYARLMVVVAESVPLTTIVNSVGALADR